MCCDLTWIPEFSIRRNKYVHQRRDRKWGVGGADCAVWLYERAVGRRIRFKRNPGFNGQNR